MSIFTPVKTKLSSSKSNKISRKELAVWLQFLAGKSFATATFILKSMKSITKARKRSFPNCDNKRSLPESEQS